MGLSSQHYKNLYPTGLVHMGEIVGTDNCSVQGIGPFHSTFNPKDLSKMPMLTLVDPKIRPCNIK